MDKSLFNKRATQKRRNNSGLSGPIRLLTPPLKFTAVLGVGIAIAGTVWAIFAKIPITVNGTGVLLPVSTINTTPSRTNGMAIYMFDRPSEGWMKQAADFQNDQQKFSDQEMLDLAKKLASESSIQGIDSAKRQSDSLRYTRIIEGEYKGRKITAKSLIMWIQSADQMERLQTEIDQVERVTKDITMQLRNINKKQEIIQKELVSRKAYLSAMTALEKQGFVSRSTILQEQAEIDNLKSQILEDNNDIISLKNKQSQAYQKVRNELSSLIANELIFAPRSIYLSQIIPNNGEIVNQGDTVLALSDYPLGKPYYVPVFLSNRDMAQVFAGMPILATPSGFQRSEVGGIVGQVISMEKLASDELDVTARVGSSALAQEILTKIASPTMAVVRLNQTDRKKPLNSGGYEWSSKSNLPFPPTPGDLLTVEITTREVHPIQLVIPAIKRILGLTPPEQSVTNVSDSN